MQIVIDAVGVAGAVVSLIGLILTIRTLRAATSAKDAAEGAVLAVRYRDASDTFAEMAHRADSLLHYVQEENSDLARTRAADLFFLLSLATGKAQIILEDDTHNNLKFIIDKVRAVSETLSRSGVPTTVAARQRLISSCHDIVQRISDIAGTIHHEE